MRIENTEVWGFGGAIRGMRNPLESWSKSDSHYDEENDFYIIGKNDMDLALRLIKAGSEHRKFLRYIHVQADITAPMYFFSEYDTYKIGTVANSTSKMHKIQSKPITLDCFETDDLDEEIGASIYKPIIDRMEWLRQRFLTTKDKAYWKELVRWLPESWLQTRTVDLNYETLRTICSQRKNHKLTEWSKTFIDWARTLPYAKEFIFTDELEVPKNA